MECLRSNCPDIFDIFHKYCDIISGCYPFGMKESLSLLLKTVDERKRIRDMTGSDIQRLMSCLNLSEDSQFNCFYNFVFFICRENGQKSIFLSLYGQWPEYSLFFGTTRYLQAVHRALVAWKIVLHGRFRLLGQWCDFVLKHQKYNISEDTWQQLLAFSRCIEDDLEGYDPKDLQIPEHFDPDYIDDFHWKSAWPVLIDDFVEHMYSASENQHCFMKKSLCACSIHHTSTGSNLLLGSKRKTVEDNSEDGDEMLISDSSEYQDLTLQLKRRKHNLYEDSNRQNLRGCVHTSVCAVEGSLSKGFESYLSIGSPFQLNQNSRAS